MKIVIRADASVALGSGHVMRCLTLARQCRKDGSEVRFVCRPAAGDLCDEIRSCGFQVCLLAEGPVPLVGRGADSFEVADAAQTAAQLKADKTDWLVVDHYQLGIEWERRLSSMASRVMVIDDLANRRHCCDLLLDQNYYDAADKRYERLVPETCRQLLGPQYALLRDEFYQPDPPHRVFPGADRLRLLIFFGGSDATDETGKSLDALSSLPDLDLDVDVVVGAGNPRKKIIELRCNSMSNVNYHCQVENMAELMARADLALAAGGSTTWERCFLGLPALTVIVAENQRETTETLARQGAIDCLGWAEQVSAADIAVSVKKYYDNVDQLEAMSRKARQVMGEGGSSPGAEAVSHEMLTMAGQPGKVVKW